MKCSMLTKLLKNQECKPLNHAYATNVVAVEGFRLKAKTASLPDPAEGVLLSYVKNCGMSSRPSPLQGLVMQGN